MNSEEVEQKVLMNSRIQTGILAAFLVIFFLDPRRDKVDTPSISQEANPQITTNVQAPDEIGRIEAMAEERGYYYQSEFGKIWGDKSDQTVGRWRDNGLPWDYDDNGKVIIPLDAVPPTGPTGSNERLNTE